MNYEKDIRIDDSSLDVEWLEQPALFMRYAKHSAEARRLLDEAKQKLDVTKAEVDKAVRENPEACGIVKVTEGAVQSAILTNADYTEAYQEYLNAKYEADMASYAVQAFNQRKEALENLVRLHGQSYFAGPKIPRDLTWEREEKQKRSDAGVASHLSRKNR